MVGWFDTQLLMQGSSWFNPPGGLTFMASLDLLTKDFLMSENLPCRFSYEFCSLIVFTLLANIAVTTID